MSETVCKTGGMSEFDWKADCRQEEELFTRYVQNYNPEDSQIRLKIIHTWKVVAAADQIAESLDLSPAQRRLVHLSALFHDIGRFEQVRRYHTFFDAKSVDHAELGAQILQEENFLDRLNSEEKAQVIRAVSVHNKLAIPQEDTGFQRTLDQMIRDADKIDIFRVSAQEDPIDTTGAPLEALKEQTISDAVYQALVEGRSVNRASRISTLDFWMSFLGFIPDLNFPASKQIVLKQGWWRMQLDHILDAHLVEDKQSCARIRQILLLSQKRLESSKESGNGCIQTEG